MILSNNPRTYIIITIYNNKRRKKYMHRWVGPSAAHTYDLRLALREKSNIKNLRRIYDLK